MFDEILHSPDCRAQAVEIVGRGIAAQARCTISVLVEKEQAWPPGQIETVILPEAAIRQAVAYGERLMELGAIEDDLEEVWCSRQSGGSDNATFERALNDIVARLDAWPHSAD
ncbi:hypothetical protein BJ973_008006 [Actinoplanes tereljensis]|uniref:hypothetical protein n=1 Tax=Paractinoplanes tereljensis TaxID=571912 RepID=UPI001941D750|nr:hypothetical protein [Actinoplanes tereljensis]